MCGIAGIIGATPLRPLFAESVRRMNESLIHRGPDDAGEFLDTHVVLAMRRLSIIDIRGGSQPLYSHDNGLVLVANGEIYNFIELRAELKAKGYHFNTGSDCETILPLYEEYGLDFVQHLRGMFAFALWDNRKRRLVLARDRMGEKPLYVHVAAGRVLFASEMKVLLSTGQIPVALEPSSVHSYMHYGWVPEPDTMINGVRKLPAGHLLVIDVDTWSVREHRYWNLLDAPPVTGNPAEVIRHELEHIASIIMRADVPVGVALSGGVDSSLIAALAAKYNSSVRVFSAGYSGRPEQDERGKARALADRLGVAFHDVEIPTHEMAQDFPKLCLLRDDPIADIAGYGYLSLAEHARDE